MRAPRVAILALVTMMTSFTVTGAEAAADPVGPVDVGGTAQLSGQVYNCGAGYLMFQDAVANQPGYQTPSGVITSWSTMGLNVDPGILELKVGREGPADTYTITGSGTPQPITAGRLNSFLTRIPVKAGDVLGTYASTNTGCGVIGLPPGDIIRHAGFTPDLGVGTTYVTNQPELGFRLNISARVEPDLDSDGYGDLTQDACPSLKNSHDDCTPPDTFLKSGPPKRLLTKGSRAKAKAKVVFFASEEGATFTCSVDKAPATSCTSPLKVKLKTGRHTVSITATDKVANVDPTPLVVRIKVTRG